MTPRNPVTIRDSLHLEIASKYFFFSIMNSQRVSPCFLKSGLQISCVTRNVLFGVTRKDNLRQFH